MAGYGGVCRHADGRGASACTIWFDTVNAVGLFEPVATHPDFQGKGLGKAVMAEGMRRMKAAGMRRAVVGFDPNFAAAARRPYPIWYLGRCYKYVWTFRIPYLCWKFRWLCY